jgi:hypothetical protein
MASALGTVATCIGGATGALRRPALDTKVACAVPYKRGPHNTILTNKEFDMVIKVVDLETVGQEPANMSQIVKALHDVCAHILNERQGAPTNPKPCNDTGK